MKEFKIILFLVICLCLPLTLYGQDQTADSSSSIEGEVFTIIDIISAADPGTVLGSTILPKVGCDVILVADGKTHRTTVGTDGRFAFSGITPSVVTLSVVPPKDAKDTPYVGTFELMPGENIIIMPWQRPAQPEGSMMQLSEEPIISIEENAWVYHFPRISAGGYAGNEPKDDVYLVSKLIGLPGVEYDKKKHLLSISGDAVHRTSVNGAFVFGQNPSSVLPEQDSEGPYSIVGQVFKYGQTPPNFPPATMMLSLGNSDAWVTLVSDRDTLRTKVEIPQSLFSISGIKAKRVSLIVTWDDLSTGTSTIKTLFAGTFELMPGENIVLIPVEDFYLTMASANYSIVTLDGDDWIFHYPSMKGIAVYVADKLKEFPGAKYSKRKETITIPSDGIFREYVNGAYLFALKPNTTN